MSKLYKYEDNMATGENQGGTEGREDEGVRQSSRINHKINDAATP